MGDIPGDILSNAVGELLADVLGQSPKEWAEQRAVQRKIRKAVERAEQHFAATYAAVDPELTELLVRQTRFADLPSVRTAMHELLTRPLHDPASYVAVLRRSFTDVLPSHVERERVDRAVRSFLSLLTQEVLYIAELRERYAIRFAQLNAEHSLAAAEQSAATARAVATMAASIHELQERLGAIAAAPERLLLAAPQRALVERPRPWHNLPQRGYTEFIGRQAELQQLIQLMLPHPRSRHFVVTIDGIGGVGKSALALELAYRYRDGYAASPEDERFAAIVWVSAKRTLLTASGIQQRRQSFTTLDDLFREVANVLEQPGILQAPLQERRGLVERALSDKRCLLLVDNLETVDDEELLSFLRELPDPTKAIITTRHRIDIAYAIRLSGMPHEDALRLMEVEAEAKGVQLSAAEMDDLERRTGGLPLAIEWSIGLMSLGHSVETVLRRLGQGQSDIARFCFAESVGHIRGRDPHRLLLALALFERSVSRAMLGEVAGLADDPVGRDEGLAELLRLSLVNQKGDRFSLLPLTHAFAREELMASEKVEQLMRDRWLLCLQGFAAPFSAVHWQQPDRLLLRREGEHLETLARWAIDRERPEVLLSIAPALGAYLDSVGRWREMIELNRTSIEYARLLGDRVTLRNELNWLAWTIGQQGRLDEADRAFAEALTLAEELDDPIWHIELLVNMAQLARRQGRPDVAARRCVDALGLLDTVSSEQRSFARADILVERGKIARDQGDWSNAQLYFQAAREVFEITSEAVGFNAERAWGAYSLLAYATHQLGDIDTAARMYTEALGAIREFGSRGYLATVLVRFAELEEQRGRYQAALIYAQEALELSTIMDLKPEKEQAAELVFRLAVGY
jgi:LuxR family glucitol operon transcriptional activator